MTTTNDAPAPAEGHLDESAVTTAMINAAFKVCPLDAAAELGTGAMQRIIAAAIAAQPAPSGSGVRTGAEMIARHRFRLGADNNTAEVDSNGLAEEIDAALASLASDASPRGEPVAWRFEHPDYETGFGTVSLTKADIAEGWKQTALYAHPAPATVESDEVSVAARFNRLATICRRIKWRNVGEPAWNDKQTADALFDLAEWLFADGVDAALAPATEGRKG